MFAKTKIALSVALILGAVSAALAYDSGESNQDENNGTDPQAPSLARADAKRLSAGWFELELRPLDRTHAIPGLRKAIGR